MLVWQMFPSMFPSIVQVSGSYRNYFTSTRIKDQLPLFSHRLKYNFDFFSCPMTFRKLDMKHCSTFFFFSDCSYLPWKISLLSLSSLLQTFKCFLFLFFLIPTGSSINVLSCESPRFYNLPTLLYIIIFLWILRSVKRRLLLYSVYVKIF